MTILEWIISTLASTAILTGIINILIARGRSRFEIEGWKREQQAKAYSEYLSYLTGEWGKIFEGFCNQNFTDNELQARGSGVEIPTLDVMHIISRFTLTASAEARYCAQLCYTMHTKAESELKRITHQHPFSEISQEDVDEIRATTRSLNDQYHKLDNDLIMVMRENLDFPGGKTVRRVRQSEGFKEWRDVLNFSQ